MRVYLDSEFKCHITNDGTMDPAEHPFFDGKCDECIEGYRFVPAGESWTREDGFVFSGGEMITPWKPNNELDAAQREYERQEAADMKAALALVGVTDE